MQSNSMELIVPGKGSALWIRRGSRFWDLFYVFRNMISIRQALVNLDDVTCGIQQEVYQQREIPVHLKEVSVKDRLSYLPSHHFSQHFHQIVSYQSAPSLSPILLTRYRD